jgi:hypothetical protein
MAYAHLISFGLGLGLYPLSADSESEPESDCQSSRRTTAIRDVMIHLTSFFWSASSWMASSPLTTTEGFILGACIGVSLVPVRNTITLYLFKNTLL